MRMTTRKEALIRLRDKVKAGTVCRSNRKAKWQDCDFEKVGYGYRVNANIAGAYNGSLDAAKALHEAVLPEWYPGMSQNIYFADWYAWVQTKTAHRDARNLDPARAWLLAILEALIAQEPDT